MNLQNSLKKGSYEGFKKYSAHVDSRKNLAIRDYFELESNKKSINIEEVEPIEAILARFDSAGMSLGALSPKAHETLAEAMNNLGARSNSGEGGEAIERYGTDKT